MVVLFALLAALLFALAGAAEQRAASQALRPPAARWESADSATASQQMSRTRRLGHRVRRLGYRARRGLSMAAGLVRRPLWIAGWVADGLGFVTQAGAIHAGSLSVVQPLLVTTLLFSLPLAAVGGRRRPRLADWAGTAAACAGLALVLSGRRTAAASGVHETRLAAMAVLVAAAAVLLALVARAHPAGQAVPLSIAAGMMFALTAAFTKLTSDSLVSRGVAGTVGYWPAYALAAVALAGLVLQQLAFSAGSLPATMTAMTITDPLVSYGLGVGGFGEHAPHGLGPVTLSLVGLGLLAAGIGVLSRSPLLHRPAPAGTPATAGPATAQPAPRAVAAWQPAPALAAPRPALVPTQRPAFAVSPPAPASPLAPASALAPVSALAPASPLPAASSLAAVAPADPWPEPVPAEEAAAEPAEPAPVRLSPWVLAGLTGFGTGALVPAAVLLSTSRSPRHPAAGRPPAGHTAAPRGAGKPPPGHTGHPASARDTSRRSSRGCGQR